MKTHKFLIVVSEEIEYILDNSDFDEDTLNRIVDVNCDYLKVIECKHENPRDNYVTVTDLHDPTNEWTFIRDTKGKLYHFEDLWTKTDVINGFE